jgi:N utilization substance protein B
MKTAKRQAREIALQALYAWQISGGDPLDEARQQEGFDRTDAKFVENLLRGVVERSGALEQLIAPHLDRQFARLSPIERAILYIGTYELEAHPKTPFKVVLNEAIELGKSFGATDGHRFVNGVLEKIAVALRPEEVARTRTNV